MILGAIADGVRAATRAAEATGSAMRVGASELIRQERIFWGANDGAATTAIQTKQDAQLRQTKWAQELGPTVPIEVLRSIDRLPTEESKTLVARLLNGTISLGSDEAGFDEGAINLNDDPEAVLEAVLKRADRFRSAAELQQFMTGQDGSRLPATTPPSEQAAAVLEQFAAIYANGGKPLNVYA